MSPVLFKVLLNVRVRVFPKIHFLHGKLYQLTLDPVALKLLTLTRYLLPYSYLLMRLADRSHMTFNDFWTVFNNVNDHNLVRKLG